MSCWAILMENFPLPSRWFLNSISIRIRPTRETAITSWTTMNTRSDSQIPWDKVGIDYLGTQECMGKHGKVLFGDGVDALRESSARRRWTPRNNAMRKNNVGMATRRFLLEIFILNSIQNYAKIINTVLISYRSINAVSMLFTALHGWSYFGSALLLIFILIIKYDTALLPNFYMIWEKIGSRELSP